MMRAIAIMLALSACHGGSGSTIDAGVPDARLEGFDQPDIVCPGPSCGTTGDGVLEVGAAKRVYTPVGYETYTDENMDMHYQSTEPYMDLNGNGKFDGVWLFGGERAAMTTHDDVEVRAIAFVEGDVSIVLVYVDCIGLLVGDMDNIRARPEVAALGVDHIIIGATHAHDAPDTVGLWGPSVAETGREDFVIQNLYDAAAAAIVEAVQTVQPAQMTIAQTLLINDPANPQSLTDNFNKDIRDPVIFDPTLTIARFTKVGDPTTTIGTIVNWADHPEVAHFSSDPAQITAHYPHWLRDSIENGVTMAESVFAQTDLAGLGGVTVFVQGALGGQIGSLGNHDVHPPGPGGTPIVADSFAKDQALGTNAAAKGLTALQTGETVSELPLSLVSAAYNARIDNTLFHVAFLVNIIGPHPLVGYNPDDPIDTDNEPWLPLRASYLQIGPLGIVTVPGELHPELWVGGYDQSWTWGYPFYDTTKPNLPDFSKAPQPPYMRDLVKMHAGVKYPMVAGLAEDYVGYIVPAYNYALDPDNPYINEAEGDHYEEVYSLGPLVEQHAVDPILQLLQYQP